MRGALANHVPAVQDLADRAADPGNATAKASAGTFAQEREAEARGETIGDGAGGGGAVGDRWVGVDGLSGVRRAWIPTAS